jgi:hypothetical protein
VPEELLLRSVCGPNVGSEQVVPVGQPGAPSFAVPRCPGSAASNVSRNSGVVEEGVPPEAPQVEEYVPQISRRSDSQVENVVTRRASAVLLPAPQMEGGVVVEADKPVPQSEEEMARSVGEPVPRVEEEGASCRESDPLVEEGEAIIGGGDSASRVENGDVCPDPVSQVGNGRGRNSR